MKLKVESLKHVEIELKATKSALHDKDVKIDDLIHALQEEKGKRDELLAEKDEEILRYRQFQKRCEELEAANESLINDIQTMKESMSTNKLNVEGNYVI